MDIFHFQYLIFLSIFLHFLIVNMGPGYTGKYADFVFNLHFALRAKVICSVNLYILLPYTIYIIYIYIYIWPSKNTHIINPVTVFLIIFSAHFFFLKMDSSKLITHSPENNQLVSLRAILLKKYL